MFEKLSRLWTKPIQWGLAGAFFCAVFGAGYGMWLYYSPESREAYIRETLSQPHLDSQRYLVSVIAWRYRSLESLIIQYAPVGALLGFGIGAMIGYLRQESLDPFVSDNTRTKVECFKLWEALAVFSITGFIVLSFRPANHGLVYYEGRDQCHWLRDLEFGDESQKHEAVTALSTLLRKPPFPCRSTIVPTLGKSGAVAEPALPILRELCHDKEAPVREAAKNAIKEIQKALEDKEPAEE